MKKNILVVDDESEVRRTLKLMLEADNHSVVEANNGAEAFGLFRRGSFDLVMTDLRMPHVSGDELAVQIKKVAPTQPILLVTAFPQKPGRENPVDAVIRKPFGIQDLRLTMARLFGESPQINRTVVAQPPVCRVSGWKPTPEFGGDGSHSDSWG